MGIISTSRPDFGAIKAAIHRKLIQRLNLERVTQMGREAVRPEVAQIVESLAAEENTPMTLQERERLSTEVLDEVFGLGPLEPLLRDPSISDILVNTYKSTYIERHGLLERTNIQFRDDAHLMSIIDRIVSAVGRRVDESSPMVDARLPDGSRVNAIIPPLAIDGPCLSIRRFGRDPLGPDELIQNQSLTAPMLELLPMNTGHDGSMTTIHANTPRDALGRLETMVAMANLNIPDTATRRQIASAIDVVVQISRQSDGKRRVMTIAEVTGMEGEVVTMQDIFMFKKAGIGEKGEVLGEFVPTGIRPKFAERLVTSGFTLPMTMFEPQTVRGNGRSW